MFPTRQCPQCGAALAADSAGCLVCGCQLDAPTWAANPAADSAGRVPDPGDWKQHVDPWYGFAVAHPPGWWVDARPDSVEVREDLVGTSAARVLTRPNTRGATAREFFRSFIGEIRSALPDFTAWEAPGSADESGRLAVRFQVTYLGVPLAGFYDISNREGSVLISGFNCPAEGAEQRAGTFRKILASIHPAGRTARSVHREPSMGAYAVRAPVSWQASVGLNREKFNTGTARLIVQREPQGYARADIPGALWRFSETPLALDGMASRPYTPAAVFCREFLAPQAALAYPEAQVERIADRPDLAFEYSRYFNKTGSRTTEFEVTAADMDLVYPVNEFRLRERANAAVFRPRQMSLKPWFACINWNVRGPVDEWEALLPVLAGIVDSVQWDPAWIVRETGRSRVHMEPSTVFQARRLEMAAHRREQAGQGVDSTSGKPDQADDSAASLFSVPAGFDRFWLDSSGAPIADNWLENPDPAWRRLEPQQGGTL